MIDIEADFEHYVQSLFYVLHQKQTEQILLSIINT